MKTSREQKRILRIMSEHGGKLEFNAMRFDWGVSERSILSLERKGLIVREKREDRLYFALPR